MAIGDPSLPMNETTQPNEDLILEQLWRPALAISEACYAAALTAYEGAAADGLCHEGALECALAAMRHVDVAAVITRSLTETGT